ncbi:DEAD/DEAH box helicase [Gabonibacter chumensis]|uniref:DEAD/DEAH box helicase n=1 Tax=Gabonibacter chumensis TaxID=2972474 RepID=UPI002573EF6C|nr:DEAD/DEAH box helicase [Gabonibacter chumensis]MCR9012228.1 DEAD/DEAH box helicase [Gabonibacter chumensis]
MRFDELELASPVLEGLDAMNFQETTPIQELTIPVILEGKDLIACAQTGTGKTAAYILPILNRLAEKDHPEDVVKALIMAPTRELAQQIDIQFEGFSYFLPVSTVVVYGGGDGALWEQQKKGLRLGADIAIATPGRLISHIQHSDIDLSKVEYFVLDEADRMLDMGFFDDIMQIVEKLPKERQTVLFSATMPPKIRQLAQKVLRNPEEINVAISKPNEAIIQAAYICHEGQKMGIIEELFNKPTKNKTIIFASSKQKVKDLAYTLKRKRFNVAAMHSDLEQPERESVMLNFKNGKTDVLVATDIVARGIDIDEIGLVINFDVPHDPEDYIHRIGRTARASADGVAITFVSDSEQGKFHRIEEFIEEEVYKIPLPSELGEAPIYNPQAFEGKPKKRFNRKSQKPSFVKKKNFSKRKDNPNSITNP